MRFNGLWRMVSGAALALVLTLGVTTAANAQYRDYGGRYDSRSPWTKQRMEEYGLRLGYHTAYTDSQRAQESYGRRIDYKDTQAYRDGMNGWLDYMGDRDDYRRAFRRGYEMGWKEFLAGRDRRYDREHVEAILGRSVHDEDPYYRNDPYNRDGRYNDRYGRNDRNQAYRIAQQNGYNAGLQAGQNDQARRRAYNYNDDSEYRNGTRGYRSEYGDRNLYRQGFQEGYRRGYEEGYRNRNSRGRFPWPF